MLSLIRSWLCKHNGETVKASCPFTGLTYTYCEKCDSRLKAEKTLS